jgi:hypothetical protein
MYIVNTDNGYIFGEFHNGLKFGMREDARRFTYDELTTYKNEILNDLKQYYCCEEIQIEYIIENN